MGTKTLEVRLRWRLVALLIPALGAIAGAAVLVTRGELQAADDERARAVAGAVARTLAVEFAEGDAPRAAMLEATAGLDPKQTQVRVRGYEALATALPTGLEALQVGRCVSTEDAGGTWRACCVQERSFIVVAVVRTDAHRLVLERLVAWMAAAVALAFACALLASRVALSQPLRALKALADWATRPMAEGERTPAPRDETVEIEYLARRFDALVADLTEALARERACTAHIAHELRTPLTAMIAELDTDLGASDASTAARIRGDAERLARVIDAILVLSSPATGARSGTIVNVADVARRLAPAGWVVEAPDEALVEAEPELVELALHNLVENAGKYAPAGGRVVRVSREADRVRLGVIDEGPGVPTAAREQMFDRYWRDAGDGPGKGLGLALVRAVAERSGGTADARDGRGTGLDVGFSLGPILGWSEV